jgi:hypothetical protein
MFSITRTAISYGAIRTLQMPHQIGWIAGRIGLDLLRGDLICPPLKMVEGKDCGDVNG